MSKGLARPSFDAPCTGSRTTTRVWILDSMWTGAFRFHVNDEGRTREIR